MPEELELQDDAAQVDETGAESAPETDDQLLNGNEGAFDSLDTGEAQDATESQAQQQATLRSVLEARGIPVQGSTDDEIVESLSQQIGQLQQYANFGYQIRPQWEQFQQWQAQQQSQSAPQTESPVKKREPKFAPLEYDPQWEGLVTRDEQGNLIPRPYTDPSVPQKLTAYQNALRERISKLAVDPHSFIQDAAGDYFNELVEQKLEQRLAGERARNQEYQFAAQALQSNAQVLYARDTSGQIMTNPHTGQPVLSAEGNLYANAVAEAAQLGLNQTRAQHYYAMGRLAEMRQASGASQAPATEQARKKFLDKINPATRTPNRNGTVQLSERSDYTQNPEQTLFQQMITSARERGLSLEQV